MQSSSTNEGAFLPSPTPEELERDGWRLRPLQGHVGHIGPLWTRRGAGDWACGLIADARHLNALGLVHGGVLATLLDQAVSIVAWEALARRPCVTVQLDTHFLAAAKAGEFLAATASITRQTRSLLFLAGRVMAGQREVATGVGIVKVVKA